MAEMESFLVVRRAWRERASGKPISFNCSTKDSSSSTSVEAEKEEEEQEDEIEEEEELPENPFPLTAPPKTRPPPLPQWLR